MGSFSILCLDCGAKGADIQIDLYGSDIKAVCMKCGNVAKIGEE